MLQHKKFVKKTKQNKIVQVRGSIWHLGSVNMLSEAATVTDVEQSCLQVSREHYLRDDIWSGTSLDPDSDAAANKLSATAKHYLVVDTNVALSQVGHGDRACQSFSIEQRTLQTHFAPQIQYGGSSTMMGVGIERICTEQGCLSGICAVVALQRDLVQHWDHLMLLADNPCWVHAYAEHANKTFCPLIFSTRLFIHM